MCQVQCWIYAELVERCWVTSNHQMMKLVTLCKIFSCLPETFCQTRTALVNLNENDGSWEPDTKPPSRNSPSLIKAERCRKQKGDDRRWRHVSKRPKRIQKGQWVQKPLGSGLHRLAQSHSLWANRTPNTRDLSESRGMKHLETASVDHHLMSRHWKLAKARSSEGILGEDKWHLPCCRIRRPCQPRTQSR